MKKYKLPTHVSYTREQNITTTYFTIKAALIVVHAGPISTTINFSRHVPNIHTVLCVTKKFTVARSLKPSDKELYCCEFETHV